MRSADRHPRAILPRPTVRRRLRMARPGRERGFTLLELVLALTLFALIVTNVLADREKSIHMAADAQTLQTVRYLAQSKIDEIRHDPSQIGDGNSGDFSDLAPDTDPHAYDSYTWDAKIERMVAVGQSTDNSDTYLHSEDQDDTSLVGADGKSIPPLYVRQLTLTVQFEPDGNPRPDLSIKIVTFIPDDPEAAKNQ